MLEILVNTAKKYNVLVADGFADFEKILPLIKGKRVAVITDENASALYADSLLRLLDGGEKLVIPAGESQKNGANFLMLINRLAQLGFQRKDCVIALGGGVVGDLAAFVASTYMRGITLIAMPTTLLSMVDSSVGGKTAIDLEYGKNLCGTFYQPSAVFVNIDTLKTLPEREILSGYGEIIKYALLDNRISLDELKGEITDSLIYKCISIKNEIVSADEFESGDRMLLNLGHTVGHAIEKLSSYTISHGECVVKGLLAALEISKNLYGLDAKTVNEIKEIILCKGHNTDLIYDKKDIVETIFADKKSVGDSVNFVTLKGVGKPAIRKLKISELVGLMG